MWIIAAILLELPTFGCFLVGIYALVYLAYVVTSNVITWPIFIAASVVFYVYVYNKNITRKTIPKATKESPFVVIIGAGLSGISAAIKLKLKGIRFLIIEKSNDVGGTWSENIYPGSGCDTMSQLYSFSFRLNPKWSNFLATQPDILAYIKDTCEEYGIQGDCLRLGTSVNKCSFDAGTKTWNVYTSDGQKYTCNFVISAVGMLSVPKYPKIPGLKDFRGEYFHTAHWKKGFDWKGKTIGLVGTGCSAVQVLPQIAKECKHVSVFQRSPIWISPKLDLPYPKFIQTIFSYIPFLMSINRCYIFFRHEVIFQLAFYKHSYSNKLFRFLIKKFMEIQMNDLRLKSNLIPTYDIGCKRIGVSNDYIPTFNRSNVSLINEKIKTITQNGVTTINDEQIKLDAIIYATGFNAQKSLSGQIQMERPLDGKSLNDIMEDSPYAYLGTFYDGFPNFFSLLGPSTELGHNSVLWMAEQQMNLILQAINHTVSKGYGSVEVTSEAMEEFQEEIKKEMNRFVFGEPCQSWYQNEAGYNFTMWPGHCFKFWWKTRRLNLKHFIFN